MIGNRANSFESHGFTVVVEPDPDPTDPRHYDTGAGRMVCWHRRYRLGDSDAFSTPGDFTTWWITEGTGGTRLPLSLYDHGGITMATAPFSCRWDSGQVGWIYMTAADCHREFAGIYPMEEWAERAELIMQAEVESYDRYVAGDIWLFTVEQDGDTLECCGGFEGREAAVAAAIEAASNLQRYALPLLDSAGLLDNEAERVHNDKK